MGGEMKRLILSILFAIACSPAYADITSNLIRHYTANDTANDATGNVNLTLSGSPTYVDSQSGLGKAFHFVASSSQRAEGGNITLTDFTVAFWGRMHGSWTSYGHYLAFDNFNATPRDNINFRMTNTSNDLTNVVFECGANGTGGSTTVNMGSGELSNWHHFALVRSGTTVTPYIDGVSQSTITVGSGSRTFSNFRIGCQYFSGANGRYSNSDVDEVRVYDAAKSGSDITELYNYRESSGTVSQVIISQ